MSILVASQVVEATIMNTDLRQNVIHSLTALHIVLAKDAEETKNLDLEERIGNSSNIMLSRESCTDKVLQVFHKDGDSLAEVKQGLLRG